jgi:hypothetical protein
VCRVWNDIIFAYRAELRIVLRFNTPHLSCMKRLLCIRRPVACILLDFGPNSTRALNWDGQNVIAMLLAPFLSTKTSLELNFAFGYQLSLFADWNPILLDRVVALRLRWCGVQVDLASFKSLRRVDIWESSLLCFQMSHPSSRLRCRKVALNEVRDDLFQWPHWPQLQAPSRVIQVVPDNVYQLIVVTSKLLKRSSEDRIELVLDGMQPDEFIQIRNDRSWMHLLDWLTDFCRWRIRR